MEALRTAAEAHAAVVAHTVEAAPIAVARAVAVAHTAVAHVAEAVPVAADDKIPFVASLRTLR